MAAHAKLSPSAASRWMACTPSAKLEQQFPNTTSVYAEEGTLAHSIAEAMLRCDHGIISESEYQGLMEKYRANPLFQEEMIEHCENYVAFVSQACVDGTFLFIEQRLDMSNYVPEGFGTGDALVLGNRKLRFFDLKYGKGVPVHAKENSQLKIYGLGALNDYGYIFDVDTVELNIYQPRLDSVSTWEISVADLIHWAETELKEKAALAFEGKGEFKPGKHCGFCRANPQCRALSNYNMELAKQAFKEPDLLTDEEMLEVMEKRAVFENWMNNVVAHVQTKALEGKKFEGWKLVQGRSVRVYGDPVLVEKKLIEKGFTNIFTDPKLVGITELTKRIGKDKFVEIVDPLLIKPDGKPTLVPADDKRQEIASASDVFNDDTKDLI